MTSGLSSDFHPQTPRCDARKIAAEVRSVPWQALEAIVHRDPAGRGLASFRREHAPLDAGSLRDAALELAARATGVGIVTGFCAVLDDGVTAETDGPPGALFLARALLTLGIETCVISDGYTLPLLACGCERLKLDRAALVEFPFEDGPPTAPARARNDALSSKKTDRWIDAFFASDRGRRLTHLIAIERPGPSHTLESLAAQPRAFAAPLERFATEVPAHDRDLCHTMRGQSVNGYTAKTHRLFESVGQQARPITTIGIGDGGNEIGMGRFAWETLVEAIGSDSAGPIACRIVTDFALVGGVSDWAAYALALAVVRLRGAAQLACDWNAAGQRDLIERMVAQTAAVDGVTLRREATVDGLPLDAYLQPLVDMRRLLGWDDSRH
jgi:hypothetical protein